MCGIAGFIDFKKVSSYDILQKATDTLQHRGPDGSGYEFFQTETAQIGLGQRRLSIIDLTEGGKQPMNYKQFWLVFNGEIYNFQEIKTELAVLGHTFKSHSDTEMILHAFEEWGTHCVDKFVGMFAFVLYDTQKNEVLCYRDRAGVKPFYYYWHEGLFFFASELKAFHAHPEFKKEIELNALAAYMQYGNVPAPYCIFKNCHKLQAGHFLRFSLDNKAYSIKKYWDVYDAYNKPKLDISEKDAVAETEKVLTKAFEYRMVADVPVGVFLSGGYDSTSVVALLQKNRFEKLKTFTIGFKNTDGTSRNNREGGHDEAPIARQTAKILGTDHSEFYCTIKEGLDIVPQLPFYYDEPFADSSAIPTVLVSKIARQHVTVALSADAGDEVFAGYNRYDILMGVGKKIINLPKPFRKIAAASLGLIENKGLIKNKFQLHSRIQKTRHLLKSPTYYDLMMSVTQDFSAAALQKLFIRPVTVLPSDYERHDIEAQYYDPLSYMMAVDYQTYLADDILQKVDRATMAVSLEGREPFLDHHVIEWAAQLPTHFKYKNGTKKHILKQIVHQYVPKALLDQPKSGFGIPKAQWLKNELKSYVEGYLDHNSIEAQGIFNAAEVQSIKQAFENGNTLYADKIWKLLMFQMWYKAWMH